MSDKKLKRIAVPIEDAEGQTKFWKTIGVVMLSRKGREYLLIDRMFNPAGVPNPDEQSNIRAYLFDFEKQSEESPPEDDIPF